ncbi:hypothetical protein [Pseudomonas sp. KNUC1026]|uniref:hypothetical protein n=1 Tax=Pseudomonas sp. KNUC1026 TaxID=2893890 RepID=UPI001F38CF03|nr:hypothetical protein [Pseudomonas sp. KNUC1026]UFH49287.1 hypothetical protein LN139_20850 [Pseudomonas sp. KNUC1026]
MSSYLDSNIKAARKWLANNEEGLDLYTQGLMLALSKKDRPSMMSVASHLRALSVHHGTQAQVYCYDSDLDQGVVFSKSIIYSYWSIKISIECIMAGFGSQEEKSTRLLHVIDLLCCTLAAVIAVNERYLSDELGEMLLRVYRFESLREVYFKKRPFESFMVWLYMMKKDPSQVSVDIQDSIFKTVSVEFARVSVQGFFELVDYHKAHSSDGNDQWRAEFIFSPFNVFVFEVVAFAKVVGTAALPNNELIDFCLSACASFNAVSDEVSQKVEDAYNEVFIF